MDTPLMAMLPASDYERAKAWYRDKLGLTPVRDEPEGADYEIGGVRFGVYPSQFAGTNQATAAGFYVDDIEKTIDELTAKGVVFEQYDMPGLKTDEKGIAELGPFKGAWFKDSEGNILVVSEEAPPS
ncbi:MAG TPA: VOC family protein [Actinomycetota bacterium]|nr:VOC family protein [Actinomycetota bacterium]